MCVLIFVPLIMSAAPPASQEETEALKACAKMVLAGFRKIAPSRDLRFEGKVAEATALCRGGHQALLFRNTPWVDWSHYWGTGDEASLPSKFLLSKAVAQRGVAGALLDLEYQRVELIKFNLFDNAGTYKDYINGRDGVGGPALKTWPEMRLKP
ncbi:MAG: peroxidase family protein, partial [Bryobacteraceae bacterium]